MKKFVPLILMVAVIYFIIFFFNRSVNTPQIVTKPSPTTTIATSQAIDQTTPTITSFQTSDFSVDWIIVRPAQKVILYSNLEQKLPGQELKDKNECSALVNGGFWSEENKHLGLFISEGKLVQPEIQSDLFNGFFSIDNNDIPTINTVKPDIANTRVALQTGPLLIKNGNLQNVKSSEDKARRIVAVKTSAGDVAFLVSYLKPSPLLGPTLSELPKILESVSKNTSLKIADAINLDGGSHSTYLSESSRLNEISPIGSFFCIKY